MFKMNNAKYLLLVFLFVFDINLVFARDFIFDPMNSTKNWQLGGERVNYVLGNSSVSSSKEQLREGTDASLKLTYDFQEKTRSYLSVYWTGLPVPGKCQSFSFWMYGDNSRRMIEVSIEDASQQWYKKQVCTLDWDGWKQITVPIEGDDWTQLLRRGEEKQPIKHPVWIRQISILRNPDSPPQGAVYFQELSAKSDVEPSDFIEATVTTTKQGNLFYTSEDVELKILLTNRGKQNVNGKLNVVIEDFFGIKKSLEEKQVEVPAGKTFKTNFKYKTERIGAYTASVVLQAEKKERVWLHRFATNKPGKELPFNHKSMFGCHTFAHCFKPEQMDTVFQLNRDAGIRWDRFDVPWGSLEPQQGKFAWLAAGTVEGAKGIALGTSSSLSVLSDTRLNLRDAITLGFWLRGTGRDGTWQWLLAKSTSSPRGRSYGVYVNKDAGDVCFTGGFEEFPAAHMDFSSGKSAWDNQWHHFAATYSADEGELRLYIDGSLAQSYSVNGGRLMENMENLQFGSTFPGALDEIVLYNRALSSDEISSLAKKHTPGMNGLVGWWSFDDAKNPGRDSGPNGLHAIGQSTFDRTVLDAKEHGIKLLGILGFPPKWASTAPEGAGRPWVYKPKLDAFAKFVEEVTRHYRGLVDHWEIWNEPNISVFWEPKPDSKEFMDVVKTGYAAAKRGNPDCIVIAPALAGPFENRGGCYFLDELISQGLPQYCDAISIHPYRHQSPEESDLVGDLNHISELSVKYGAKKKIWITEWCWNTYIGSCGVTEDFSAKMTARGIVLAMSTGLMDRIIWFRLNDDGVDRFYSEHNYGLCYDDLTPKPSYFAFRTCSQLLDGAQPAGKVELGDDVIALKFICGNENIIALWCPNGEAMTAIDVKSESVCIVDIMGNERIQEARDGVLLIKATEAVQFLRGLGKQIITGNPLIIEKIQKIVLGEKKDISLILQNPFKQSEIFQLELSAPDGLVDKKISESVLANGTKEIKIPVNARANILSGHKPLSIKVNFAGINWVQIAKITVTSVKPKSGPVGYWNFDEGEEKIVHDSSGNDNHGAITGCVWVAGKKGMALEFGGGEDVVIIPDSPPLDLLEEVTVAFWLKLTDSTGTWQFPVNKFLGDISRNYGVYVEPGNFSACFSASFEHGLSRHTDVGSRINLNDGKWHHIAALFSSLDEKVIIYIDGKSVTEQNIKYGMMLANDEPIRIGAGTKGTIDEVRIYGRALAPKEVEVLASQ